jgi:SAM-dependent methyltransferase
VDADAIAWCQSALGGAEFETTGPLPPLPYSDASFNLIYAVSVFTHLSEGSQRAWLPELHRLLKPGGRLVVSVYGRGTWAQLAEADVVARGGFVFLESGKLKGIQPEWYQTAFQSRARLEALLGSVFPEVCYREGAFGDQDAAVARKAGAVTSPGSIASS